MFSKNATLTQTPTKFIWGIWPNWGNGRDPRLGQSLAGKECMLIVIKCKFTICSVILLRVLKNLVHLLFSNIDEAGIRLYCGRAHGSGVFILSFNFLFCMCMLLFLLSIHVAM